MRQVLDECREHERIFQDLTRQGAVMAAAPEKVWHATRMSRPHSTSCSAAVSSLPHCLHASGLMLSHTGLLGKASICIGQLPAVGHHTNPDGCNKTKLS